HCMSHYPPQTTLFPYTTLFRSHPDYAHAQDQFNHLNGYQLEPKAKKILAGLGYKEADFQKTAREFSGGWIMRAYLARLLVQEPRSEEHTSELQSRENLVCRLLL